MAVPKRTAPTPRAQRIYDEITSLTVVDVVWITRQLRGLFGDDGAGAGVREPLRPIPPDEAAYLGLELPSGADHPENW